MLNALPHNQTPLQSPIKLFTIGFTKRSARAFFGTLLAAGVERVIDTRLNNVSQLAGFTKRADLAYFLETIGGLDYVHLPELAPTQAMLTAYKKQKGAWEDYERDFIALLVERQIERAIAPELLHQSCLLCSEAKPDYCHRRLVAEYFREHWGSVEVCHL